MFLPWAWRENDRLRRVASATLVDAAISVGVMRFVQESFAPVYPDCGDRWIDETERIAPVRYNLNRRRRRGCGCAVLGLRKHRHRSAIRRVLWARCLSNGRHARRCAEGVGSIARPAERLRLFYFS